VRAAKGARRSVRVASRSPEGRSYAGSSRGSAPLTPYGRVEPASDRPRECFASVPSPSRSQPATGVDRSPLPVSSLRMPVKINPGHEVDRPRAEHDAPDPGVLGVAPRPTCPRSRGQVGATCPRSTSSRRSSHASIRESDRPSSTRERREGAFGSSRWRTRSIGTRSRHPSSTRREPTARPSTPMPAAWRRVRIRLSCT
jgi:hypothetical protein